MSSRDAIYVAGQNGTLAARVEAAVREANVPRLTMVALQFALLLGLMQLFHLEYASVRLVLGVALIGFVVHHLLPMPLRLPFFVLLSLGSLAIVVLPMNALRLASVGSILIGMCHLPIRFAWRIALVMATALGLTLARAAWLPMPGFDAVWPILGSMFMFRLIIYLYDLRNGTAPFGIWRSLAYFFMLPNVCFPMYPLVDYQTFNRTYFNEPTPWRMYQVGIKWIFRGMIHLLLYRFITQNMTIVADYVTDAADLVRYMVTTFLLYLQISGQFHLIIGVLHLFGFNLPETHHNYLLSSSFTDFWRRINIYWKDFILKVFFNPVYFRTKHWGPTAAMIVATLVAFFFTWALHSYQWFWIRGSFPVTWQDAVFWSGLAFLVLVNVLYEQRYGRSRLIKGKKRSLGSRVALALRTIGTFCVIVTLWCLWTFQGTFGEWLGFMSNFARMDMQTAVVIVAGLAGLGLAGALCGDTEREYSAGQRRTAAKGAAEQVFAFWRSSAITMSLILAAVVAGAFGSYLPIGKAAGVVLSELKRTGLSAQDRAERDRGYYEDLTNTRNYNLALWELYNRRPSGRNDLRIEQTSAGRKVPDQFHLLELVPSQHVESFRGAPLSTNRWAMRDRDYSKHKPAGTYRVALLGASITMGAGIADDQTYENLVEDRLNRDYGGDHYERFELLNFAVGGFSAPQKLWAFERALEFESDVVIWETHPSELEWLVRHLSQVTKAGVAIPYPDLQQRLEVVGLGGGFATRAKLWSIAPELMNWVWERMRDECGQRGVNLQVLLLPRVDELRQDAANFAQLSELAEKVGLPVIDVTRAYDEVIDRTKIRVSPQDDHPNADGHRLLADELYRQMLAASAWQAVLGVGQERRAAGSHERAAVPLGPDDRARHVVIAGLAHRGHVDRAALLEQDAREHRPVVDFRIVGHTAVIVPGGAPPLGLQLVDDGFRIADGAGERIQSGGLSLCRETQRQQPTSGR